MNGPMVIEVPGPAGPCAVHWRHAGRELLEAAATIEPTGTWRRGWIDEVLTRYGRELAIGMTLGDIADRAALKRRLRVVSP